MATFLFLCAWEHPPPSCGEHIAIGRCPVPGCADWPTQALLAYYWPIICRMPHPHPALEQSGTVDTQREEGDARFVMYFWPRIKCFLCVTRVWVCVSVYVWVCVIVAAVLTAWLCTVFRFWRDNSVPSQIKGGNDSMKACLCVAVWIWVFIFVCMCTVCVTGALLFGE